MNISLASDNGYIFIAIEVINRTNVPSRYSALARLNNKVGVAKRIARYAYLYTLARFPRADGRKPRHMSRWMTNVVATRVRYPPFGGLSVVPALSSPSSSACIYPILSRNHVDRTHAWHSSPLCDQLLSSHKPAKHIFFSTRTLFSIANRNFMDRKSLEFLSNLVK